MQINKMWIQKTLMCNGVKIDKILIKESYLVIKKNWIKETLMSSN